MWVDLIGLVNWFLDFHGIQELLARFKNFKNFAEDLSRVFCRIYRIFKVLIFSNKRVVFIGLGNMFIKLDLLDDFHGFQAL